MSIVCAVFPSFVPFPRFRYEKSKWMTWHSLCYERKSGITVSSHCIIVGANFMLRYHVRFSDKIVDNKMVSHAKAKIFQKILLLYIVLSLTNCFHIWCPDPSHPQIATLWRGRRWWFAVSCWAEKGIKKLGQSGHNILNFVTRIEFV